MTHKNDDSLTMQKILQAIPSAFDILQGIYPCVGIPDGMDVTKGQYLISFDDIPLDESGVEKVYVCVMYFVMLDGVYTVDYLDSQNALQVVELALKQYVPELTICHRSDATRTTMGGHEVVMPGAVVHFGPCRIEDDSDTLYFNNPTVIKKVVD